MWKPLLCAAAFVLVSADADAKRLKPSSVSASSTYPMEDGQSYDAKLVHDGKLATSWVEGDSGGGLGAWVQLNFDQPVTVKRIRVWGGMWYSYDFWNRANRPKQLEIRYSTGEVESFDLPNDMLMQEFTLAKAKDTEHIQVRIKGVHNGSTWTDTAISEVQVFDGEPEDTIAVRAYESSSLLAADADGSYEALNVADGLVDSLWCEGSAEGDGVGEWLQFSFGVAQKVGHLRLVNGVPTTFKHWMNSNRATGARLTFSDGSTEEVKIKNSLAQQEIAFTEHRTDSVKVEFTGVSKGKEYNDLCIAEAYFAP